MKVQWYKKRVARAKGPFIYLHKTGPVYFAHPGSIVECCDEAGYALLEEEGDIIKRVEDTPEEKPKRKPRRSKTVPSNKSMSAKEIEVK